MITNKISYLLVFENFSKQVKLKQLFSSAGLKDLETHFQEIANYTTNSNFKIHLYQVNERWLS